MDEALKLLEKASEELRQYWFDKETGEYNNEETIVLTKKIEEFIKTKKEIK